MRGHRLFIALAIVLVGVSLLPLTGLGAEPFSWERYADAYQPTEFVYLPLVIRQ